MKQIIFLFFVICISLNNNFAQPELGVKLGVSSYDFKNNYLQSEKNFNLALKNSNFGIHGGIYGRFGILGISIQPEINFNSNFVNYTYKDFNGLDSLDKLKSTRFLNFDIPLLIMVKPSIFRIYAGPVGHYFLTDDTRINLKDGIKDEFNTLKYGYNLGLGVNISRWTFDIRYEGNFTKYLDVITLGDHTYSLNHTPSRLLFSLWFRL